VAEALRLPYVGIALSAEGEFSIEASVGQPTADALILPLLYQGESVGQIMLGRRPGEANFSPADRSLRSSSHARQAWPLTLSASPPTCSARGSGSSQRARRSAGG
jgi:hypothetical protein